MLTRLIIHPAQNLRRATNQVRQQTPSRQHFRRGNAVVRLGDASGENPQIAVPVKRSAIVEPKRKPKASIFGDAPDDDREDVRRRGEAADELFREIVRRAAKP
jgi:hypothetical protein